MTFDLDRIQEMEHFLNECTSATADLAEQLQRMDTLREPMIRLSHYYGSPEWYADRKAELPKDISAGVLSEDAAWNAITNLREAALHMLELATDILKHRI